jgi:hypothetical protein
MDIGTSGMKSAWIWKDHQKKLQLLFPTRFFFKGNFYLSPPPCLGVQARLAKIGQNDDPGCLGAKYTKRFFLVFLLRANLIRNRTCLFLYHRICFSDSSGMSLCSGLNPKKISDPRVRLWDAGFGPPEWGGHFFGRYLRCKIKENGLKIEGVTY